MSGTIAIFATYFIGVLIAYVFFSQIADKKHSFLKCCLIGTAFFSIGALCDIIFNSTVWINAVTFIIIHTLFALFCFNVRATKILFYSIIMDIFSAATEIVTIFIISAVTDTEITAYISNIYFFIIDVAISKTLYFLICLILSALAKKDKNNIRTPITLYFYPIVVVLTMIALWSVCANYDLSNSHQILLSAVSALLFFSIVILFIVYQMNIAKENQYLIIENEIKKEQIDKNYYKILEHQNKELMIYAHDAKNHLNAIKALNENEQIDEYLNQMTNELKSYSSTCHSGNHTLDVIINKYVTECEMKEISFKFDVRLSNLTVVSDYDLVTVLGNILDNAVEASSQSEKRYITFKTNKVNTYDSVIIVNSCDSRPKAVNGELKTTKSNSHLHGLGLKSVMKILKKYKGDLEWEYSDELKEFTTTVILK